MRIFKKIDIGLQISIAVLALVGAIGFGWFECILIYFFGYLTWDLISILIHLLFFSVPNPRIQQRRSSILLHVAIIIGTPLLLIYGGTLIQDATLLTTLFAGYLAYTALMPLYYLWMSSRELKLMNEVHDQVTLLDIGQH